MGQYALFNKKMVIEYDDIDSIGNFTETLINYKGKPRFIYNNIREFYGKIDKLITDPEYLKEKEFLLENLIIEKEMFSAELKTIIEDGTTKFELKEVKADKGLVSKKLIDMDNKSLRRYYELFARTHFLRVSIYFPKYFVYGVIKKVSRKYKLLGKAS